MKKPVLLFDGDCGFCRRCLELIQARIPAGSVEFYAYQEKYSFYPQVEKEKCEEAVHYVDENGNIFRAAEAIFLVFSKSNQRFYSNLIRLYRWIPLFKQISEFSYRAVANHRYFFSRFI